jgi:predicted ATPase
MSTSRYPRAMSALQTLAVANYRSIRSLVAPLAQLNLITGANGSGKSNLYRALRLLAEAAQGGIVSSLAREGGLSSTLWAGPETISRGMKQGTLPVQGGPRKEPVNLRLGFLTDTIGYSIDLGLPQMPPQGFHSDPEIKLEAVWAAPTLRPAALLAERRGQHIRLRGDSGEWKTLGKSLSAFESMLSTMADPERAPELLNLREEVRSWRFYDHFRADAEAPARQAQVGTLTPVLAHDGRDLAAALQTVRAIGDGPALDAAVTDAFPGARVHVETGERFTVRFEQRGLLRPLSAAELSDGTLRYLLWIAALLTPRPPSLMILNEPETSLHPDLLPALARLIEKASARTQVWVVSHASRMIAALRETKNCNAITLTKELGQTAIEGQGLLDAPPWKWPER